MLLQDNLALAESLKPGKERVFTKFKLVMDWNKDGAYSNTYSDLSDNIESVTLDAQFTGNYPDEYEINDGYAQRKLTVVLSGQIAGVPIPRFFSPFSGQWGGSIGAVNTPAKFSVFVLVGDDEIEIPQFTGFLLTATPSRAENNATLEFADITSQLTSPMTYLPTARSQISAQYSWGQTNEANETIRARGGNALSWYLTDLCRRNGLYQSPPPPAGCVAYWTLAGGVLPEIGGAWLAPLDGRQGSGVNDNFNEITAETGAEQPTYWENAFITDYLNLDTSHYVRYGPTSPAIQTPSKTLADTWEDGPFGPRMKMGISADFALADGNGDFCQFNGHTKDPIYLIQSGSNTTRVYGGGWQLIDRTKPYGTLDLTIHIGGESTDYALAGSTGRFEINFSLITGGSLGGRTNMSMQYRVPDASLASGGSPFWNWFTGPTMSNGWHYVSFCLDIPGNSRPTLTWNIDGTVTTGSLPTPSPSITAIPVINAAQYSAIQLADGTYRATESSFVSIHTNGGANNWGVWTQDPGAATRARVWSMDVPYEVKTDISISSANSMWTPRISGVAAWDVMKDVGSADLGVVYVDEEGMLHYQNWQEIQDARDSGLTTTDLTLDDVIDDFSPYNTFDSVRNIVSMSTQDKWFIDTQVYKSPDPGAYTAVPKTGVSYASTYYSAITSDDVMSVLPGAISNRPWAQGYTMAGDDVTEHALPVKDASVAIGIQKFDFQAIMQQYGPDFWRSGFTAHNLGDQVSNTNDDHQGLPLQGERVAVITGVGWTEADKDPGRLTVVTQSDNHLSSGAAGRTSLIAIDDNTAFLNVRGYLVTAADAITSDVRSTNQESFDNFGERATSRPQSDWANDYTTQYPLTQKLADELAEPRPVLESTELVGDPRRQLQDVVRLTDPDMLGGPIYASVVGINRTYSLGDGCKESLTMRTFGNRGGAWQLGISGSSELGETTILNSGS